MSLRWAIVNPIDWILCRKQLTIIYHNPSMELSLRNHKINKGLLWPFTWAYFSSSECNTCQVCYLIRRAHFALVFLGIRERFYQRYHNSCDICRASYTQNNADIFFNWASTYVLFGLLWLLAIYIRFHSASLCLRTSMLFHDGIFFWSSFYWDAIFWRLPSFRPSHLIEWF